MCSTKKDFLECGYQSFGANETDNKVNVVDYKVKLIAEKNDSSNSSGEKRLEYIGVTTNNNGHAEMDALFQFYNELKWNIKEIHSYQLAIECTETPCCFCCSAVLGMLGVIAIGGTAKTREQNYLKSPLNTKLSDHFSQVIPQIFISLPFSFLLGANYNFFTAAKSIEKIVATSDLQQNFSSKLLASLISGLIKKLKNDLTGQKSIEIYKCVETYLLQKIEINKDCYAKCSKILVSIDNQTMLKEISSSTKDPFIIITRGTSAFQTLAILENVTMGGAKKNDTPREPPTEEQAIAQTGYNIKETDSNSLEEWSLNPQGLTGFSTGGFMLIASVKKDSVRMPPPEGMKGEMGVTGWSDLPLNKVAIKSEGPKPLGDSYIAQIDALCKALAKDKESTVISDIIGLASL